MRTSAAESGADRGLELGAQRGGEGRAGDQVPADRAEGQVDHREGRLLERRAGGAPVKPSRELEDRGLQRAVELLQRRSQGGIAVDQVLAAQRRQQARVGRVRLREVVQGERRRDRAVDRITIAERGQEALLRAADRADPRAASRSLSVGQRW